MILPDSTLDTLAGLQSVNSPRMRVLLLGDDGYPASTVSQYLQSIEQESRHHVEFMNPIQVRAPGSVKIGGFNAVIIHYSVLVIRDYYLSDEWSDWLTSFDGVKVQIIQDEYRWIDEMATKMAALKLDAIVSSLAPENLRRVYHHEALKSVTLVSALPGYVTRTLRSLKPTPLSVRPLDIVYRGRELPYWLGRAAREKLMIAEQARAMAGRAGLGADIDTREEARIYGDEWTRFLCSGRCVLATEGGASIFDFDGSAERDVARFIQARPDADFDTVWRAVLAQREGNIVHRTITPRVFEAVALGTALVMYPGNYRGVVRPWEHYIPLHPDGSNESKVIACIRDLGFLAGLVERARRDLIISGRYSSQTMVRGLDALISELGSERQQGLPTFASSSPVREWGRARRARLSVRGAAAVQEVRNGWDQRRKESRLISGVERMFRDYRSRRNRRGAGSTDGGTSLRHNRSQVVHSHADARCGNYQSDESERNRRRLEILLLCDYRRDIAATVADHIEGIRHGLPHNVTVLSILGDLPGRIELRRFDVVIVHYTLVMCMDAYLSPNARERLAAFPGLKAAFVQDEYRFVDRTIAAMEEIGVQLLFTCVPATEIEKVYPSERLPGVHKINVLTGYVPDSLLKVPLLPYGSRPIDVGYRSRDVPEWLGELGQEKTQIARRFREDAPRFGLRVDISTLETDRIYGERWVQFIQSCKAMLGVESGASVFDFTGEIQHAVEERKRREPDVSFRELQRLFFADKEWLIDLRQISPRCFEAACLGTLMVLYEGEYSGVLVPWRHFVPLKKDHSNMEEVVAVIRDPERAESIIACARSEVVDSGRWSYATMAKVVADGINARFEPGHRAKLTPYQARSFELMLFLDHRLKLGLQHLKRRAITLMIMTCDRCIHTCVPERHRPQIRESARRLYHAMGNLLGRPTA